MRKSKLIGRIFVITLALIVICAMLGGLSALLDKVEASPVTICVPDDYLTIQAAVNASSSGDTVIVRDGTYIENVDVNIDHLTIQSQNGANSTIVQAANPDMNVFYIRGSYVTISGFTVQGATGSIPSGERSTGIHVCGADYCNVFGNIACNNFHGICVGYFARNNIVASNNATNNTVGIGIYSAYDNTINDCVTSNNTYGIAIWVLSSSNDMLARDNNLGNGEIAAPLPSSNSAVRSYVLGNLGAIASNNTVIHAEASNNDCGIYLRSLSNNIIYLSNFIDNTNINVYSYNSTNTWNSQEEITYTYDGSIYMNHLGNYWSDYYGGDVDGDGIGEVPYLIYSDADNYPLVEPFENYATGVDISVVLQGGSRPPEGWEVPINIKFFSPGADVMTDTPIEQFDVTTTKSDSTAVCQCTVAPGTYDITVVSEHTLINVKRNVIVSGPSTAVDMVTLLEGNANGDSIINISDFGILAVSYMKTDGEPGYDPRADFDRNGIINISDFGLLAVNYMEMSPIDISG